MPLQYVQAFLLAATEENLNVSTYATRAGTSQSLMTRHLLDLGEVNRYHEEGMGFVEAYRDMMDRRQRPDPPDGQGQGRRFGNVRRVRVSERKAPRWAEINRS